MKAQRFQFLLLFVLIIGSGQLVSCGIPQKSATIDPVNSPVVESEKVDLNLQSPTGFYWPTGKSPDLYAKWLASNCNGQKKYLDDESGIPQYHTGVDIKTKLADPVFAVADGIVIHLSINGWGKTGNFANVGALIEHHLKDGSSFVAIYGHLQTKMQKGDRVKAGEQIGTIGNWNPTHLHLTISPGKVIPISHYGMKECPPNGTSLDPVGYVDPMIWLTTQYPGPYQQGEVLGVSDSHATAKPVQQNQALNQGKIVFVNETDQIEIVNIDGTERRQISLNLGITSDIAWSPDGSRIAFHGYKDTNHPGGIYISREDGTDLTQIASLEGMGASSSPYFFANLDWSPDGKWIAFSTQGLMYIVGTNRVGLKKMVDGARVYEISWSPDGKTILFSGSLNPDNTAASSSIFLLDLDSGKVNLLQGDGDSYLDDPSWSPDNRKIAYKSNVSGIMVVNLDGNEKIELVHGLDAINPQWISPEIIIFYKQPEPIWLSLVSIGSQDVKPLFKNWGADFDYSPTK